MLRISTPEQEPFRIPPTMPASEYKTYRISSPIRTHWVKVTCEEINCEPYLHGWTSSIDERTVQGAQTVNVIRNRYRIGTYTETKLENGLTLFTFSAGQPCFISSQHKKQIRPDRLLVQGGDYRGNPLKIQTVVHTKPEFWAEDFAEHQDNLAKFIERG